MIPDHLIDKAVRAQIIAEGSDPDDHCERWKFGSYDHDVRVALEAVAADIFRHGYNLGKTDGLLDRIGIDAPSNPNPYRNERA